MPRATMTSQKVVLDLMNEQLLWDVVSEQGFCSVPVSGNSGSYVLGTNAGAAYVHSRDKDGGTKVSSQKLKVVSEILATYQTDAAMKRSADSYGGINTKSVYLNPTSSISSFVDSSGGSSTGSDTAGGGGSQAGGGSSTGSDTAGGGSSTGSETAGGGSSTGSDTAGGGSSTGSETAGGGSSTGSDTAGGEPQNPGDGDDLDQD